MISRNPFELSLYYVVPSIIVLKKEYLFEEMKEHLFEDFCWKTNKIRITVLFSLSAQ